MYNIDSITKQFTDMISEGFIFIDKDGKIQVYNNKAKEIFGITLDQEEGHHWGYIQEGDIVLIGNNSLGTDDGNLTPEKLNIIGIEDDNIQLGDALIAICVMEKSEIASIYKYKSASEYEDLLQMDVTYMNQSIYIRIDFINRNILIQVNEKKYNLPYHHAVGHMVILEKNTKKVKFYQAKGYTIRAEGIYDVLQGQEYRAKGRNIKEINVIGKHIFDIHSYTPNIIEFYDAARGQDIEYYNKFQMINGRPTICSLLPVDYYDQRIGAVLKVEDISELRRAFKERDEAICLLEQIGKRENETFFNVFPELIGESGKIIQVKKLAYRASKTNSTVLILGESGTGKSMLAKAIHEASDKKDASFIYVNCATIPENLIESELFGYEGGAFTGANREGKSGMFELAHGGTVFLDEIGELSIPMQVKLLHVLQTKSFYKLGGSKKIKIDIRIIAATNTNLEKDIEDGKFREDLYYRINVFPIWMPSLRDIKEDLHNLIECILPRICKKVGCENKRISGEAIRRLESYDFPGNVRELENILERSVNLADGNLILANHIIINKKSINDISRNEVVKPLKDILLDTEKTAIEDALNFYDGNKKKAMKALAIGKTSFYEKIKRHKIISSK